MYTYYIRIGIIYTYYTITTRKTTKMLKNRLTKFTNDPNNISCVKRLPTKKKKKKKTSIENGRTCPIFFLLNPGTKCVIRN